MSTLAERLGLSLEPQDERTNTPQGAEVSNTKPKRKKRSKKGSVTSGAPSVKGTPRGTTPTAPGGSAQGQSPRGGGRPSKEATSNGSNGASGSGERRRNGENSKTKGEQDRQDLTPNQSATVTPVLVQPPAQSSMGQNQRHNQSAFGAGEDFLAFNFSDNSEFELNDRPNKDRGEEKKKEGKREKGKEKEYVDLKGKGKAREDTPPTRREDARSSRREQDSAYTRSWDRGKRSRSRSRSRDRDRRRRWSKDRNRDRDRDRDHYDRKRKHDRVDDDAGYSGRSYGRDVRSRALPWMDYVDWDKCMNTSEMLHYEVESFVNWISPSPVEDEVRGLIVKLIEKAVMSTFPDARVLPFGSYETKLYLPEGDIDLVILSDQMAYQEKGGLLHFLAGTMRRWNITSNVTIIAKARVPIIKFVTKHGKFNVDISINQATGILSGAIVNGFIRDMHGSGGKSLALRSLVMITKAFLSQRSMNEVFTGGLGSYSIVCLAISFLQMHPKIRRGEIDPEKNLGVLVLEFFELYGCYFNYDEVGISVRDGGTYYDKHKRGWNESRGLALSIEDPADPSNDISKGSFAFSKVRATLAGAYVILTSTAYLRAGLMSSRRSGRTVRLGDQCTGEDLSILSGIMRISQSTLNHRRLVQELYDSRTLHDLLGIKPAADVIIINHDEPRSKEPRTCGPAAKNFVQSVWQEAEEEPDSRQPQHDEDYSDEEEGRYHIGREPVKKRRKTDEGTAPTTFIADDEGDSEDSVVLKVIDDTTEEGEYASDARSLHEKSDNKRSYWLSKGIGHGDDGIDSA